MHSERIARRSFLLSAFAATGAASLLAGCGDDSKEVTVTKQEDPSLKAKESMEFYQKNNLKKGGANK